MNENRFIICADGGAKHLAKYRMKPDLLLGDFDSLSPEELNGYREQGVDILQYPAEKDMTDTELAVEEAVRMDAKDVLMLGVLGTRYDHSLSNIFLLKRLHEAGIRARIVNEHNEITLTSDRITLIKDVFTKVSLLPLTMTAKGVTTKGLYYPLTDATLLQGSSRGISNEYTGETAEVSVKEGILIVIRTRD